MGNYSTGGKARERKLIRYDSGANSQVWMGEEHACKILLFFIYEGGIFHDTF